jgi:hypothetical protein
MGAPFSDITLYTPTPHKAGTPEYWENTSLQNFVSDLYVQKMCGYKPPNTNRISVQPAYYDTWKKPWKFGSINNIAPYYSFSAFNTLNKNRKYQYVLNLIQRVMLELSDEYQWDKTVFEKAYKEVIKSNFLFTINYPSKLSRDKKKSANLCIEKTETVTSVFVIIQTNGSTVKTKLFDKNNEWWYDCTYLLARHCKWYDTDKFGISYTKKANIKIWYSIKDNKVSLFDNGTQVEEIDFKKYFPFG